MTKQEAVNKAKGMSDFDKESWAIGESEYPGIGGIINTWKGQYLVIAQGYGGRGWVLTVSLDKVLGCKTLCPNIV
jgi:hypothetical protein